MLQAFQWSWRESNPRPNKQPKGFLHAQLLVDCREYAGKKQSNLFLIFFNFRTTAEASAVLSQHLRCFTRDTVERGFSGNSMGLISKIKQPLRNCNRCHLCGVRIYFTGNIHNTRHAYTSTRPAVKSGQPLLKCGAKIRKFEVNATKKFIN